MPLPSFTFTHGWANGLQWTDALMTAFANEVSAWTVSAVNETPSKSDVETIAGPWTFSSPITFENDVNINGELFISGALHVVGSTTLVDPITFNGDNTFNGQNTFAGANSIILPNLSPNVTRGIGAPNSQPQIFDGTAVNNIVSMEKAGALTGHNVFFKQGADSSQLTICDVYGSNFSSTVVGRAVFRQTSGLPTSVQITSSPVLDLTGCTWAMPENITGAVLHVYGILQSGSFILGVGFQNGFTYIRNTQDDTTAAQINLPEEIFTSASITVDNSPMIHLGYIIANYTQSTAEWAITEYHPHESGDDIWFNVGTTYTGFSVVPSATRRACQRGRTAIFVENVSVQGTSNATTYSLTLPWKANITITSSFQPVFGSARDNSVTAADPSAYRLGAGSTTLTLRFTLSDTGWTASGGKAASGTIVYETFQP